MLLLANLLLPDIRALSYGLKQSCYYWVKARSSPKGRKNKCDQRNSQNLSCFFKVGLICIILSH